MKDGIKHEPGLVRDGSIPAHFQPQPAKIKKGKADGRRHDTFIVKLLASDFVRNRSRSRIWRACCNWRVRPVLARGVA